MGWNPVKWVKKTIKKTIKTTIKIVKTVISWLVPQLTYLILEIVNLTIFEKGILLNKQSNDASIPVIYGIV